MNNNYYPHKRKRITNICWFWSDSKQKFRCTVVRTLLFYLVLFRFVILHSGV